jgi:hypothetical protein
VEQTALQAVRRCAFDPRSRPEYMSGASAHTLKQRLTAA